MIVTGNRRHWGLGMLTAAVLLWTLTAGEQRMEAEERESDGQSAAAAGESPWGPDVPSYTPKSKRELRKTLTRIQYSVTQQADTERAFTGANWDNKRDGIYACIVCKLPLFDSKTKFESGTGWPSFWAPIRDTHIGTKADWKMLYRRTEVHCKRCKAHLGHVFGDGPQPTGLRYCMNGAALNFQARDGESDSDIGRQSND